MVKNTNKTVETEKTPNVEKKYTLVPESAVKALEEMLGENRMTYSEIGKYLSVSRSTISVWCGHIRRNMPEIWRKINGNIIMVRGKSIDYLARFRAEKARRELATKKEITD
jgi:DNA invertase Pin-like site-specific DNA recombinase